MAPRMSAPTQSSGRLLPRRTLRQRILTRWTLAQQALPQQTQLRDLETIRLAISAAETGHLVFGTLHTNSAPKTIDRIIDVFPAEEKAMVRSMLSESLRAVISQTLLKKVGGGRIAAHEIMVGIPAIRNLIREDKVPQMYSVIQTGQAHGMQTMDQCLQRLVAMGVITKQDAAAKSVDKQSMNNF